ncbi:MAG TPA: hypothetical protein VEQ63_09340 [Bryobacteraceae bacterium]|nr:hypothetical protein [Bryobacteraceae bacterium]
MELGLDPALLPTRADKPVRELELELEPVQRLERAQEPEQAWAPALAGPAQEQQVRVQALGPVVWDRVAEPERPARVRAPEPAEQVQGQGPAVRVQAPAQAQEPDPVVRVRALEAAVQVLEPEKATNQVGERGRSCRFLNPTALPRR